MRFSFFSRSQSSLFPSSFILFALSSVSFCARHLLPETGRKGWNFSRADPSRPRGNCRTRRAALIHSLHPVFHLAPFNVDLKINFASPACHLSASHFSCLCRRNVGSASATDGLWRHILANKIFTITTRRERNKYLRVFLSLNRANCITTL